LRDALQALIALQKIDCQLQKLEQSKGDLPQKLDAQALELQALEAKLATKREECKKQKSHKSNSDEQVLGLREKLKKYRAQLYQVKNNREYDAITAEIESAEQSLEETEFAALESEEASHGLESEMNELSQEIDRMKGQSAELQLQLNELLAKTRDQEAALLEQRKHVLPRISKPLLNTYERIRGGRGGMAMAMLKDGACSECSSRIPPQRGLEIRMMDKLYWCETCGRILVWIPELEQICPGGESDTQDSPKNLTSVAAE